MEKKLYLAYGSNLNIPQMARRCPTARIYGTAEISNYELLYKGSKTGAYLTIEIKKGGKVPVAVWEVTPADERNLDMYEGFPNFYYKKNIKVNVKTIDGKTKKTEAFVYIMHEDRKLAEPSIHYVRCCEEGYRSFKFDLKYLNKAYERSVKDES